MTEIEIIKTFVRGQPEPQPRHHARAIPNGRGGYTAQAYHPMKYPKDHACHGQYLPWIIWRDAIKKHFSSLYAKYDPIDEPLILRVNIYVSRPAYLLAPKSPFGEIPCSVKPDIDNYFKLICDAMGNIWEHGDGFTGIWTDDGRIYKMAGSKWYPARDKLSMTGAMIQVAKLKSEQADLFLPAGQSQSIISKGAV